MDALGCALLPSNCVLCGSSLPHLSLVPICDACWVEFPPVSGSVCIRCGERLEPDNATQTSTTCRACRMAPPAFQRAVAYGVYEARMRDAIHAMKYGGIRSAAKPLGHLLAEAIGRLEADAPAEMLVVPVPLHHSRHAQRGFNQARLLAMSALETLGTTHPDWRLRLASKAVIRMRPTTSQASLTPRKRRLNLRGAFRVADPKSVAGRHILVIDDIFTTGATARAMARELERAGAASVWIATLARAHWVFGLREEP